MSTDIEQFVDNIKQLIPISDLSAGAQKDLIEEAEVLEFKKKKFVFKESDKDNYSFYLLAGELELISGSNVQSTIIGGSDNARYALARLQPRQFSAKAKTPITILRLDRDALDRLIVNEGSKSELDASSLDMDVSDIDEEDSGDWMTRMLKSELFARLPMANIQQLFAFLEPITLEAGEDVIKQGEPGDHYYIIQEGSCEVTRVPREGEKPVKLAELTIGDSFGEEALLTNATRNATITMLTDGVLMQLSKDNFVELIKNPSLSSVSFQEAKEIVGQGGQWIDVRFAKEYEASSMGNSINIPLNLIRTQLNKFNNETHYILCCDTGGRSSAAAFLLTEKGFRASYLQGGLVSYPDAAQVNAQVIANEAAQQPAPAAPEPEKLKSEKPEPEEPDLSDKKEVEAEVVEEEIVDISVKVSALETDLARKQMDIEAAEKSSKENEQADKKQQQAYEAERKKLEQERLDIEKQKKLAEEELNKKRKEEEEKIEKSKKDAESRMQEEKEKLEAVYMKNTEEMKKLQEMKARAEAQIKKAREQLEKQASESKRELDEARNLKSSVEEARKKIDMEAEQQRIKQTELEANVKAKAKALLEAEKRKLAEKFAQNNEKLAQAHREKAIAEAGRIAAKEESEKIIEEYRVQFEKEKAEFEAKLNAERAKLEKESQQIRDKLNEVHKAKEEAETARKLAEEEASTLKQKQAEQLAKGDKEDKELAAEMKRAEEKLEEAKRLLDDVQHEEKMAEAAKEGNEEDLLKQKAEEERLRKQLESELDEWKEEEVVREKQFEGRESQAEHIRRIKERAEEARKKTQESTDNLFSDISKQISDTSHHKLR